VYDDSQDTITLYIDGQPGNHGTVHFDNGWHSTGPLQVGRAHTSDGWGEYLHGAVDEVHAFAGALSDTDVGQLGFGAEPCLCGGAG
jgi:hypothetical protein